MDDQRKKSNKMSPFLLILLLTIFIGQMSRTYLNLAHAGGALDLGFLP